jgi:hypothetical protein
MRAVYACREGKWKGAGVTRGKLQCVGVPRLWCGKAGAPHKGPGVGMSGRQAQGTGKEEWAANAQGVRAGVHHGCTCGCPKDLVPAVPKQTWASFNYCDITQMISARGVTCPLTAARPAVQYQNATSIH